MAWRDSFHVPPNLHQNPIPTVARVGPMVFTSIISGRDPDTGKVPEDPAQVAVNCFRNMANMLAKAGAKLTDVGHVTVYLKDDVHRPLVNKPWLEMFPDEHSRPARHAIIMENLGSPIQIEAIAYIEGWTPS